MVITVLSALHIFGKPSHFAMTPIRHRAGWRANSFSFLPDELGLFVVGRLCGLLVGLPSGISGLRRVPIFDVFRCFSMFFECFLMFIC